jgi:hypothetical protein
MWPNPLAPVVDYQSMLNRIFWFATASALIAVWMLRLYIPAFDRLLGEIDFTLEFGGDKIVPVPGGYLFPALALGVLTRIYRLHARISDWLGIRECFDIEIVIGELASQLEIDLTAVSKEQLVKSRHHIMRKAFYPFVSGPQPHIDPQLVHQALDAWSWFWIGVEATFVFVQTGFALTAAGIYDVGIQTIGLTVLTASIGIPGMRKLCRRYAVAQVRAILADPNRASAARAAFAELAGDQFVTMRAA